MPTLSYARFRNALRLTHYLFRFPAKFHPPVLRRLLDAYSSPGDTVLDPFVGSGTLLVEALVSGRNAIGLDIDPLAVFVSRAKTTPIAPERLEDGLEVLLRLLEPIRRSESEYTRLMHADFEDSAVERLRSRFDIPAIPNIHHWFRNYAVIDLARLRSTLLRAPFRQDLRNFFLACFASIIRNASNADPVPVSGLEVTAHMRELDDAGRRLDPFDLFERRVRREIRGMNQLWEHATDARVVARRGDATHLRTHLPHRRVELVITSPPYNTAVDYYRRHTLEMYWLNLVASHEDRLRLAPKYLGRAGVRLDSSKLRRRIAGSYVEGLVKQAEDISAVRARALKHFAVSMQQVLSGMATVLKPRGLAVIVVGNAKWNGRRVQPTRLLEDLASRDFRVLERWSYGSRNRYMSYERRNGGDINREHVLVLRKR